MLFVRLTLKVEAAITVASRADRRAPLKRAGVGSVRGWVGAFSEDTRDVGLAIGKKAAAELSDKSANKARQWNSSMVGRFEWSPEFFRNGRFLTFLMTTPTPDYSICFLGKILH